MIKCYGRAMCVTFDETGSILWTGDDRGNMFAALFDMTTGKLHSCKRYLDQILRIIENIVKKNLIFQSFYEWYWFDYKSYISISFNT